MGVVASLSLVVVVVVVVDSLERWQAFHGRMWRERLITLILGLCYADTVGSSWVAAWPIHLMKFW